MSNLPGFTNHPTPNPSPADYSNCKAPITSSPIDNGLTTPAQPSASNNAFSYSYSHTITDGATYSVTTSLTLTSSEQFAITTDSLGNNYQPITAVSGTRVYTHLSTSAQMVSTVTGLSSAVGTPSQYWYPFAYLQSRDSPSAPAYTVNNAPFLDGDGLGFQLDNDVSVNGNEPGTGPQSNVITVLVAPSDGPASPVVLTESSYNTLPDGSLQQQSYTLIN